MRIFILLILATILLATGESFATSKKELRKIYQDHQVTFYCDCQYNYKDTKNMINKNSCGYKPRVFYYKSGKQNVRSKRIEWEHIMPAENFGRHLKC